MKKAKLVFGFISLLGVLLALVFITSPNPIVGGYSAQELSAKSNLVELSQKIDLYYAVEGRYPEQGVGLNALACKKTSQAEYCIERVPLSPWGSRYKYSLTQNGYKIWVVTPDGVELED